MVGAVGGVVECSTDTACADTMTEEPKQLKTTIGERLREARLAPWLICDQVSQARSRDSLITASRAILTPERVP